MPLHLQVDLFLPCFYDFLGCFGDYNAVIMIKDVVDYDFAFLTLVSV